MNWRLWPRRKDPMPNPGQPGWEHALINTLALEYLRDQRRRRRWGMLMRIFLMLWLIALLVTTDRGDLITDLVVNKEHTALIDIKGIIASDTNASAERVNSALRAAFRAKKVKGIILKINSPGGSPVQAGYIHDEIKRLKEKYKREEGREMPVYAVAADLCASGGYYVAVGTDAIYVNPASLVGSIGVRIDGFGFQDALAKLGIERRLLIAGANKGMLDPFSPLPETQRVFLQHVLDTLHQQFITVVKDGRGPRLKGGEEIFSGLFWTGQEAVDLGLADAVGTAEQVAREVIHTEEIVDYTEKPDLYETVSKRISNDLITGFITKITEFFNGDEVHEFKN